MKDEKSIISSEEDWGDLIEGYGDISGDGGSAGLEGFGG